MFQCKKEGQKILNTAVQRTACLKSDILISFAGFFLAENKFSLSSTESQIGAIGVTFGVLSNSRRVSLSVLTGGLGRNVLAQKGEGINGQQR